MVFQSLKRWWGAESAPSREREEGRETRELPPFDVGTATEPSPTHPERNEDAFFADGKRQLIAVADGVGGSVYGEVASQAARDALSSTGDVLDRLIEDARRQTGSRYLTPEQASAVMDAYFRLIADRVRDVCEKNAVGNNQPVTTLLMVKVFEIAPGQTYAVVKGVGDCEAFVERADGMVEPVNIREDGIGAMWVDAGQVTEDEFYLIRESGSEAELAQMYIAYQIERGQLPDSLLGADANSLQGRHAQELARIMEYFHRYFGNHKFRALRSRVTQVVGEERGVDLEVHSAIVRVHPGDIVYARSDGSEALKHAETREAVRAGKTVGEKVRALLNAATLANARGDLRAKPDDAVVVGMEVAGGRRAGTTSLEEVGFENEIGDVRQLVENTRLAVETLRAENEELTDLEIIDAGSGGNRKRYIELINKYARLPGGEQAARMRIRPFYAQQETLRARLVSLQSELRLLQARQQLYEAERDAREHDPSSPIWRLRVANARGRVNQIQNATNLARANAEVQRREEARVRAIMAAERANQT